jgi:hypothetical protein
MPVYPKPVPQSPPATPQPFKWLWAPRQGFGVLQIGQSVYVVHECHFDDDNGRQCFCVRLRRHGAEYEYQICQTRDNDLTCDCADSVYRQRECKHVAAVRDAYAQLDRQQRLDDFMASDTDADSYRPGHSAGIPF